MNQKYLYRSLSGFLTMLAVAACAFSKQKIPIVPTTDLKQYETSVAGTKQVVAQLTKQAAPTLVSVTSTPKVSQITKTSLVSLDDQSTVFIDQKAGVQVTIPPGWLTVRPNEDEYYKAFALEEVLSNPAINDRLTKLQSANTDFFRLDAIDIRPEHVVDGIITVMSVNFQPDDFSSLEKWAKSEETKKSPFKEYGFISSSFQKTTDGTHILVVQERWKGSANGTLYHREVFFSLASGTLMIDLQTNRDFKETVLPDFEQVINSLTLLNP